jgi:flagella basal body P-ring formation protein FlgA
VLCLITLACVSRAQDRVALRAVARLSTGAPVLLSDIAEVNGPRAATLGQIVVSPEATPGEIDLAAVRRVVEAVPGVNPGRIVFSGSAVTVRAAPSEPAGTPEPPTAEPAAIWSEPTVRQHLAARISEMLGVPPSDLRLNFEERREELLNTRTRGRIVTAQQTGGGERMCLSVRVYEGDTLITQGTLTVGVLIRREVGVLKSPVSRGEMIPAELVTTAEQWLPPTAKPVPVPAIAGRTARARINAGDVVEERDIEATLAVRKGDFLSLDCISGSVVVRTTAKALADAREGDTIPVETIQWRKTLTAKVSRSGHAVAVGAAEPEASATGARTPRAARTKAR